MPRHFNTAGPNRVEMHYTLPALARLPDVHRLVRDQAWFVLHAPRQTGKTTVMRALAQELTASGNYAALWATCEMGEPFGDRPVEAGLAIAFSIASNAVTPPNAAPYPTLVGTAITGAAISPATTDGSAPSIPATATTTRAFCNVGKWCNSRCKPATPTS